jgi:hypothetical protein
MDFAGLAGYTKFFGTKEPPNKPARSAPHVAAWAAPGGLVEIEVLAIRPLTSPASSRARNCDIFLLLTTPHRFVITYR